MGFKTGTASTTVTDYTVVQLILQLEKILLLNNSTTEHFWTSDTVGFSPVMIHRPMATLYNEDTFAPNQPVGTVINVVLFCQS